MSDLFRAAYLPGHTVWIEARDGHFYKGQVLAITERYTYKQGKAGGKKHRVGSPSKLYRVHTMDAKAIQGGSVRFQVMCTHGQLYPRTEVSSLPPNLSVLADMIKEKNEELLRGSERNAVGEVEGDVGHQDPDLG
jgi:hypothetical protein